jgi:predicted Zn finger-like uncharacterized protein
MVCIEPFKCPNCGALYRVVKTEAGPKAVAREIKCRACGAPLNGRDGQFVLKYFLTWNPGPLRRASSDCHQPARYFLGPHDTHSSVRRRICARPVELGSYVAV